MTPVAPAHAELLAEMHARCFPAAPWGPHAMAEILAMPGAFGFLSEEGFALGLAAADTCDLTTLGVLPESRRRGTGERLLRALIAEARRRGAVRILLEVAETNPEARNLYERCGFTVEGIRKNYYAGGVSALTMRRPI
jgi:ribosomal-protein-alanine N-acetyltransferase